MKGVDRAVPQQKKVLLTLPDSLISDMDRIATADATRRSSIMQEAIRQYVDKRNRQLMIEQMKKGYLEMANINLALAIENSCLEAEVSQIFELPERGKR